MKIKRREMQNLNMSFLDTISNAFGSMILLLVFSKLFQPAHLEQSDQQVEGKLVRYEQQLNEILGNTEKVQRDRNTVRAKIDTEQAQIDRLQADLTKIKEALSSNKGDALASSELAGRLAIAKENLSSELQKMMANYKPPVRDYKVGGIPVDSEYVIFVIDNSGSMKQYQWDRAMKELRETLDVYPHLKGIQVMNDEGIYLFQSYRKEWIPDSPARRKLILDAMKNWNAFSNSSPREGLLEAIHDFYDPNKNISIYYFGDDFSQGANAINATIREIDRENHSGAPNGRRVRIHAVAFPTYYEVTGGQLLTAGDFATLMRVICERNGGTFIALPPRQAI
jgi:hypothetical protein